MAFITSLHNPRPEREARSISFSSPMVSCANSECASLDFQVSNSFAFDVGNIQLGASRYEGFDHALIGIALANEDVQGSVSHHERRAPARHIAFPDCSDAAFLSSLSPRSLKRILSSEMYNSYLRLSGLDIAVRRGSRKVTHGKFTPWVREGTHQNPDQREDRAIHSP